MKELARAIFTSSQSLLYTLIYARELVRKSANSLLTFSSTTESLVDHKVRAISTEDILLLLVVAGFFAFVDCSHNCWPEHTLRLKL